MSSNKIIQEQYKSYFWSSNKFLVKFSSMFITLIVDSTLIE